MLDIEMKDEIKEAPEAATSHGATKNNSNKLYKETENKSIIFCDGKCCIISGGEPHILARVCQILEAVEKAFAENHGKQEAQGMIDKVIENHIKHRL